MNSDAEFDIVFGHVIAFDRPLIKRVDRIRCNDPDFTEFTLQTEVADRLTDSAWVLLGKYIAQNEYLETLQLRTRLLTDANMALLFRELSRWGSISLKKLELTKVDFGLAGVRSMVPFLKKTNQTLTSLEISQNGKINTVCFRLLLDALQGGSIQRLRLRSCNIDSIAAFEHYTLPYLRHLNLETNSLHSIPSFEGYTNLEHLSLEGNWIGRRGYPSIAKLLKKKALPLRSLDLTFTGMCDPEAQLVADALKQNTSLKYLRLEGNKIQEGGRRAFLKLLNDVSTIEATCNSSNHTLHGIELPRSFDLNVVTMFNHIDLAINRNKQNAGNPQAAGRAKVIETQLHGNTRMELSSLQLVGYSYNSIFPQIDTVLLPNVLSLVGSYHGHDELYHMLMATVPDLVSIADKKAALKEQIADNVKRMDVLQAEYKKQASALLDEYHRQLAALTAENERQSAALNAMNLELQKELDSA